MRNRKKLALDGDLDDALTEARDLLQTDPKVLRRKVRRVAAGGDKDPYALALYTLAAGHKFNWTPEDWAAVLDRLDGCDLTVGEWLQPIKETRQ